jgi:adenylate cyclase class 2
MFKEEIEMKAVLRNPGKLRSKLKELGAKKIGKYKELNIKLDFPDMRLEKNDIVLRLRKKGDKTILTLKSSRKPGKAKIRDEYETEVEDFETILTILKNLGFVIIFKFEKIREEYEFQKANVVIDRLPKLGYFCEIEANTSNKIYEIAKKLGIKNLTKRGYGFYIKKLNKKELMF